MVLTELQQQRVNEGPALLKLLQVQCGFCGLRKDNDREEAYSWYGPETRNGKGLLKRRATSIVQAAPKKRGKKQG